MADADVEAAVAAGALPLRSPTFGEKWSADVDCRALSRALHAVAIGVDQRPESWTGLPASALLVLRWAGPDAAADGGLSRLMRVRGEAWSVLPMAALDGHDQGLGQVRTVGGVRNAPRDVSPNPARRPDPTEAGVLTVYAFTVDGARVRVRVPLGSVPTGRLSGLAALAFALPPQVSSWLLAHVLRGPHPVARLVLSEDMVRCVQADGSRSTTIGALLEHDVDESLREFARALGAWPIDASQTIRHPR